MVTYYENESEDFTMEIKDRIRYDANEMYEWFIDITDLALELFGDDLFTNIIEKVEINVPFNDKEYKIVEFARHFIDNTRETITNDSEIELDAIDMYITFKNGKIMEIYNSEFGGIGINTNDK